MKRPINLLITGLPRSGTSLLCSRVNSFVNTAVINEPAEVFRSLKQTPLDGLQNVFDQYRGDIADGKRVYNKIKDGKFIEDTRLEDSRSLHLHSVDDGQFILGIKNTLIFMSLLSDFSRSRRFPFAVASIRHPYDCIASWHSVSFPHLREAKPAFLLEYASPVFKGKLQSLLQEPDLTIRSAQLWLLLAQALLAARGRMLVVRYEDMVKHPSETREKISDYLGANQEPGDVLKASKPVRRREELTQVQRDKISEVCAKIASQFGYRI